jgi:hypothetical protein
MMDVDDGYILWTGIWKGTLPLTPRNHFMHGSLVFTALGNSKGLPHSNSHCGTLAYSMLSRHSEDDRVSA